MIIRDLSINNIIKIIIIMIIMIYWDHIKKINVYVVVKNEIQVKIILT